MENQGSNYKQEVMEALDLAPSNKLSGAAFKWAASHLPDEGKQKGSFDIRIQPVQTGNLNHEQESVLAVFGFDDQRVEIIQKELARLMQKAFESRDLQRNSHMTELIINESSDELKQILMLQGIGQALDVMKKRLMKQAENELPDDILRSLKDLRDMLGDLDPDSDK